MLQVSQACLYSCAHENKHKIILGRTLLVVRSFQLAMKRIKMNSVFFTSKKQTRPPGQNWIKVSFQSQYFYYIIRIIISIRIDVDVYNVCFVILNYLIQSVYLVLILDFISKFNCCVYTCLLNDRQQYQVLACVSSVPKTTRNHVYEKHIRNMLLIMKHEDMSTAARYIPHPPIVQLALCLPLPSLKLVHVLGS